MVHVECSVRGFLLQDQSDISSVNRILGDRAYQELIASAKPSDGMPARIERRTHN